MQPVPEVRRCAVYTRKSSEEGLEQDFNSLQAQREACEAFIASQRGEGWRLISAAYDDGGLSGGTMERPALQQLLSDIQERKVDVVVVYKVDRLTRSLSDFARIVEVFDAQGVSFVAVTQQFNTTTSMGRLTLNVLLSFAQFEREVTGERIRDKIAASKKKGMWMGGTIPLGYTVVDRKLVVAPGEAESVRAIYEQYLQLPGVRELVVALRQAGIRSKSTRSRNGGWFSRGALYALLSNPLYVGKVRHKGNIYPGQHEEIVPEELWQEVQRKLTQGAVREGVGRKTESSPLLGKLVDEHGRTLTPSHAVKKGRRYRYYVSAPNDTDPVDQWRLPAPEIERCVAERVEGLVGDRAAVTAAALSAGMAEREIPGVLAQLDGFTDRLGLVEKVGLSSGHLETTVTLPFQIPVRLTDSVPMRVKRRGMERKLVIAAPTSGKASPVDQSIAGTVRRALEWWEMLSTGKVASIEDLAKAVGRSGQTVGRIVPLALLAPDIVEAIAEGRQPVELTTRALLHDIDLPASWAEQRKVLGFT
jgi:DNA invertase Pin-like site-specific DNA recombinase